METQEKPQLKCRKQTIISVNYGDFDKFVNQVYGVNFDFVNSEECGNDTTHSFHGIDGEVDDYDQEDLDSFKENKKNSYMTRILLNDLCKNGFIEPGDYYINVCW
jgi:hypothetical protein